MDEASDKARPRIPSIVHGKPHEAAAGAGVQDTKASKAVKTTMRVML